jgi:hypothetical protein
VTDVREALGAQRLAGELRRCVHDRRYRVRLENGDSQCARCQRVIPAALSKRSRASRSRGNRRELYVQRTYGPVKVGQRGDAIDNIGRTFKWQSKTTQLHPPVDHPRCARCEIPMWVDVVEALGVTPIKPHAWITVPVKAMEPLHADLKPLLIRSWTRQGVGSTDVIVAYWGDWWRLHGDVIETPSQFVAMSGRYFLDMHGRDE